MDLKEELDPPPAPEPKNMDLIHYCLRALGEWQAIDLAQYKLLNVEKGVKVLQHSGQFPVELEVHRPPQTSFVDWRNLSATLLMKLTATRLTVFELDETDETPPFGVTHMMPGTEIHLTEDDAIPDIQEILNLRKFIDQKRTGKDLWLEHEGIINCDVVDALSPEEKAEYYWALRLRHRSSSIVLGILESISELEKLGYLNWILPNGNMIPLRNLKLGMLEVIPHQLWLVNASHYFQVGALVIDYRQPEMIPTVALNSIVDKKIFVKDMDPELGPIMMQYVLEAGLSDGTALLVDPTARQYGFKGPYGTLVVHGSFHEYADTFPGVVIDKVTPRPELEYEANFLGNGNNGFIHRLAKCLIQYLPRRICNYCGQVEGYHPEDVKRDMRYKFEASNLFNCPRCKSKSVCYCSRFCQQQDWIQHRITCVKFERPKDKFGLYIG